MKSVVYQRLVMRFGSEEGARKYLREYKRKQRENPKCRKKDAETRARAQKQRKGPAYQSRLCLRARKRARDNGMEATIKRTDLSWPSHCPVLGVPLLYQKGAPVANQCSLDRWDNSKGYVPGNVYVISYRANTLKGNATVAEMEAVLDYMRHGPIGL